MNIFEFVDFIPFGIVNVRLSHGIEFESVSNNQIVVVSEMK